MISAHLGATACRLLATPSMATGDCWRRVDCLPREGATGAAPAISPSGVGVHVPEPRPVIAGHVQRDSLWASMSSMDTSIFRPAERFARAVREDPLEMLIELRERVAEHSENRAKRKHGRGFMPWPPCPYEEDLSWEADLHALMNAPWPCPETAHFNALWAEVMERFASAGTMLGRGAFAGWGDGEPGFVRSVWCITRHLRPAKVVETGV